MPETRMCGDCGDDCTDNYIQITHRYKANNEKKSDVLKIQCLSCYNSESEPSEGLWDDEFQ